MIVAPISAVVSLAPGEGPRALVVWRAVQPQGRGRVEVLAPTCLRGVPLDLFGLLRVAADLDLARPHHGAGDLNLGTQEGRFKGKGGGNCTNYGMSRIVG
jgi:hypothetical protein